MLSLILDLDGPSVSNATRTVDLFLLFICEPHTSHPAGCPDFDALATPAIHPRAVAACLEMQSYMHRRQL